jgi:hypothetical protein
MCNCVLFYYVDLQGNYIVFSSSTCPEAYTVPLNEKLAIKRKYKNSHLFTERAELWKTYIFQIVSHHYIESIDFQCFLNIILSATKN